jgi:hypothetical protein
MKKMLFLSLGITSIFSVNFAEEAGPVCAKCEKVREYNAAHPENNYVWYDDYLKDKSEGKAHESELKTNPNANKPAEANKK